MTLPAAQTLRIDGRGFRTSYLYDYDDRLTRPALSRRHAGHVLAYDKCRPSHSLSDSTGRTTTTYDADGRTTLVVNPAGLTLTYAYDAASRRKYPSSSPKVWVPPTPSSTWPVESKLCCPTPQAQRSTYSYDAASRVTGTHFANTTRASYSYDNANRLLRRGQSYFDQHNPIELLIRPRCRR